MHDLTGKTAVITGASRGIGAAAAVAMAKAGASVVLAARSVGQIEALAEEIRGAGGHAVAVKCDVSAFNDVQRAVDTCIETFGKLDIFVANAGVIDPINRLEDSDPTAWARSVEINLFGAYNSLRAAIPAMKTQGSGTFINISSGAAHGPMEGWSHYCAAKAASAMLLRNAHLENGEYGIRFIGFRPGTVATDMQVAIKSSGVNPVSKLEVSDHYQPEWPAQAIAWMCTADADGFLGQEIFMGDEEIQRRAGLV